MPKKYTNLMIDLETLGTGANALIISIAAVPFEFHQIDDSVSPSFQANISIQSGLDAGMKIDGETLTWWLEKKHEVLKSCLQNPKNLHMALAEFRLFWGSFCTEDTKVWGRGPSFDNGILADAFHLIGKRQPWEFYNDRCVRTYLDGYDEQIKKHVPFSGDKHNPLDDAFHQVNCLQWLHMMKSTYKL